MIVQRFITKKMESGNLKNGKGLSTNTVNGMITVIQNSLGLAYTLGITPQYEMDKLKRPKPQSHPVECFSKEEQKKIEQAVVSGYRKIEDGVVGGYKKLERGVVEGFGTVTDKCVEVLFAREGESVEDAKKRLSGEE